MPMLLVDVVLGRNKIVLQRQLESFCAQYKSCLDVDGDMDRARREVFSVSRQLTTAQAKVTTEMLAGVTRAELLVTDVRE